VTNDAAFSAALRDFCFWRCCRGDHDNCLEANLKLSLADKIAIGIGFALSTIGFAYLLSAISFGVE
jgi:hypothetical protein